jgi:APA family basic amino acid/polyamine antiporter
VGRRRRSASGPIAADEPTRLARQLGTFDAVVIGLGSMVGAGVFAAVGPAAAAAGSGLLIGLALAGAVAYCNAVSSAQLAALHPQSGGAYVYGRERLGPQWGAIAGWAFVIGKTASCAAMALTFGTYAAPGAARPAALAAVVLLTLANDLGIRKAAWLTRLIVVVVLVSLALVVVAGAAGGTASWDRLGPVDAGDWRGVAEAGGLLFFAFAGYARIATLGEEVRDPARTIPRAIPVALGITLVVYTLVFATALLAVGPEGLATAEAPLRTVVSAGRLDALGPAVRVGAAVAALGVLLSLLAGVSRTAFAMAGAGDLWPGLAAVHPSRRVPHRAGRLIGVVVAIVVLLGDVRHAIGFSSFAVLTYYAVTNAAACTLRPEERRWPRALCVLGLVGCLALAVTLPGTTVLAGVALVGAAGLVRPARALLGRRIGRRQPG